MAELQYVLSNQVVAPFWVFNQASLLSCHFKLKICLNLNMVELPFPVYWPDCYHVIPSVYIFFTCEPAVKIILVKNGRINYYCSLESQRNSSPKLKLSVLYFFTLETPFFFFLNSVLHVLLYLKCKIGICSPDFLNYSCFFS